MPLPTTYPNPGTITIIAGNPAIVGNGTLFTLASPGDMLWDPESGIAVGIQSITDDEHLTLRWGFPGGGVTDGEYEIWITPDTSRMQETYRQVLELLRAGQYARPDAYGTLAQRAAYDTEPAEFVYWRVDVTPFLIYVKLSATPGDWSAGSPVQGPQGEPGTAGINGQSFQVDVVGAFEDRDLYDAEDDGFSFLSTTAGDPEEDFPAGSLYFRQTATEGVWSDPVPFGKGETGDEGPQGEQGDPGAAGPQGDRGWSPSYSVVSDGTRRVLRLDAWIGGQGIAPTTGVGQYLAASGYVLLPADALDIRGPQGAKGDTGDQGIQGSRGWNPILQVANDGARRVLQLQGWTGGEGTTPTAFVGQYLGAGGFTATIGSAIDVRGPQGIQGTQGNTGDAGATGNKGWAPVLAIAADGTRRVHQVIDWTGGEGTKPATGSYVGSTGLVVDIADAIDIRGATGAAGAGAGNVVSVASTVQTGEIPVFSNDDETEVDGSGVILTDVIDDIEANAAAIAAIPDPVAMSIIFGGA